MKTFISFAEKDHRFIHILSGVLVQSGIDALVASQVLAPGTSLDAKVQRMIEQADAVVVILTPSSLRSRWVQQEIGYAKAQRKPIIPLKTRSVSLPAMLLGLEYVEFKLVNPVPGFEAVCRFLSNFADEHHLDLRKSRLDDTDGFRLLHLPDAMLCPKCKNVDVHVFVCLLCGEWVCNECGETVPPSSRAVPSARRNSPSARSS
jgi:hypothetical protein